MEAVGLKSFIESNPQAITYVFPTMQDIKISAQGMKDKIQINDDQSLERNAITRDFFFKYIDLLENRKQGGYVQLMLSRS